MAIENTVISTGYMIQAIFGLVLVVTAYFSRRRFKIVLWKRGWLLVMVGGESVIFFAVLKLLLGVNQSIIFSFIEASLTYGLIAAGIVDLGFAADKIWGTGTKPK